MSEWSVLKCGAGKWVQVRVISNQVRVGMGIVKVLTVLLLLSILLIDPVL